MLNYHAVSALALSFISYTFCSNDVNDQLFKGIAESNLVTVVEAINNGADLNAAQQFGNHYTPVMAALDALHAQILDQHTNKQFVFVASLIAGAFETSFALSKFNIGAVKGPITKLENAKNIGISLTTFAGLSYLSNLALQFLAHRSSELTLKEAYLITHMILMNPTTDCALASDVTGANPLQMITNFRTQLPHFYPGYHPFTMWHVATGESNVLNKIMMLAACFGFDYTVQLLDSTILQKNLDAYFEPLAQEIQKRMSGTAIRTESSSEILQNPK